MSGQFKDERRPICAACNHADVFHPPRFLWWYWQLFGGCTECTMLRPERVCQRFVERLDQESED
jgi:hypothetical protein